MKTISVSRENFEEVMNNHKYLEDVALICKCYPGYRINLELKSVVKPHFTATPADVVEQRVGAYVVEATNSMDYTETVMSLLKQGYRVSSTYCNENYLMAVMILDNRKEVQ